MEIIIGAIPRISPSKSKPIPRRGGHIEARVLNIRPTRKRYGKHPGNGKERRGKHQVPDPAGGRVVTLLIPEGYTIPPDLDSGNYRVFLRFSPQSR